MSLYYAYTTESQIQSARYLILQSLVKQKNFFPAVQDKTETNLFYQQVFDFFFLKKAAEDVPWTFF